MTLSVEENIKRVICVWLKENGIPYAVMNVKRQRGTPDLVLWMPGGRPTLIELKQPGEEPRANQAYNIATLTRLGYDVQVFDDADKAKHYIRGLLNGA